MHTYTYIHAYSYIHTHKYTHTFTHVYKHAHIHTQFQVVPGLTYKENLEILIRKSRISIISGRDKCLNTQKAITQKRTDTFDYTEIIFACQKASQGINWEGKKCRNICNA